MLIALCALFAYALGYLIGRERGRVEGRLQRRERLRLPPTTTSEMR